MGFEKYNKQSGQSSSEPRISLRKSGSIGLNTATMNEFFSEADGAILYYDEDTERVGLEPASKDDPDAYSLSSTDNNGSITASGFMQRYDLVPDTTTHYAAQWDEEAELVYANLDEPVITYGSSEES